MAVRTSSGTTVYSDVDSNVGVAVQTLANGVRVLIEIKKADAPHEYRFPITLPAGAQLLTAAELFDNAELDTGEVFALDASGRLIGGFNVPWATDARGKPVSTSYRVDGTTLIQRIDVTADTTFPVIADPDWWKITGCAGAITVFVATNGILALKVAKLAKKAGGIYKLAERIV